MNTTSTSTIEPTQIVALLQEAKAHYLRRNLKKALNTARIAVEFSKNLEPTTEVIQALLLLSQVYNTNGRYLLNPAFFPQALDYIKEAEQLNTILNSPEISIEILFTYGKIYLNQKKFHKAKTYFRSALSLSQKHQSLNQKILSWVLLSQTAIRENNFTEAEQLSTLALDESSGLPKTLIAEIFHQFSQIYIKRQEYSRSLEYSQALLALSKEQGDIEKELTALNNIAIVSGVKSNYKIAVQYFLEALNKSEAIGYRHNIAHCLINIGTIYAHLYNYEEALHRYEMVLQNYADILDDNTKVIIYNNVGNIYYTTEKYDIALQFFGKALILARKKNYQEMTAHSLAQMSRAYIAIDNYEQALFFASEAYDLIQILEPISGRQINLINLGEIFNYQGNYEDALTLTKEGITVSKELKDHASEIRGYQLMANIYKNLNDFEQAFKFQLQYSNSQEEFSKIQRSKQFLDLEIKYAIKEKQQEIELLTKENNFQSLLLNKSEQIARQNEELLQVNDELRQFAYVASHDLKEPLRMIGSYTQLIQRMFKDQINENSELYFHYVTDGVKRMNNLLDALLKYATVGKAEEEERVAVDLNYILEICQVNLKVLIDETQTEIHLNNLPTVNSISSLLVQLLQNLLSNAIKFRKPDTQPVVQIQAIEEENEYVICVQDNGIGIKEEFKERIFVIFQRLHSRTEYQGTGIGLAICQKIVQRLGGKIWVESEFGQGAAFYFTLPK